MKNVHNIEGGNRYENLGAKASGGISMRGGGRRGGGRRTPPPDLPSILFDNRIIYLGLPVFHLLYVIDSTLFLYVPVLLYQFILFNLTFVTACTGGDGAYPCSIFMARFYRRRQTNIFIP